MSLCLVSKKTYEVCYEYVAKMKLMFRACSVEGLFHFLPLFDIILIFLILEMVYDRGLLTPKCSEGINVKAHWKYVYDIIVIFSLFSDKQIIV